MKHLFPLFYFISSSLSAASDSAKWDYRFKGVDFKIGYSEIYNKFDQSKALLLAVTPDETEGKFLFENISLNSRNPYHYPIRMHLSAVLANNNGNVRRLFKKSELCFGLTFETQSQRTLRKKFSNIQYSINPDHSTKAELEYTYQSQSIELGYQFAGRPFLKQFALFGGINAAFGINTYKQIVMNAFYNDIDPYIPHPSINAGYFSSYANLGIKYNFSCDLNFFSQYESGFHIYGKPITGYAHFNAIVFGIRYKFLDEQDQKNYKQSIFW
ncbi:MAG TPA: hypothetical protein VGF79_04665 [Bacteroidia bacterium]